MSDCIISQPTCPADLCTYRPKHNTRPPPHVPAHTLVHAQRHRVLAACHLPRGSDPEAEVPGARARTQPGKQAGLASVWMRHA